MKFYEKNFDERQILIRGSVAMQTVIMVIAMMMVAFLCSDWISSHITMEDMIRLFLFTTILFFCESLILRDAYVTMYSSLRFKRFMTVVLLVFLVYVGIQLVEVINDGTEMFLKDGMIHRYPAFVCGVLSITYFLKLKNDGKGE